MAKFQCPGCRGWDIYQSKYRFSDLFFFFAGFPRRCGNCHERFYTWRYAPPRPSSGGSAAVIEPPITGREESVG